MKKAQTTPTTTKLSKRNKEMVKLYMSDREITKKAAYAATHKIAPTTKPESISAQVTQTFSNPLVKSELERYSNLSEDVVVSNITTFRESSTPWERQLSNENAKWVHDKIFGKATQRTESTSVNVNIEAMLNEII